MLVPMQEFDEKDLMCGSCQQRASQSMEACPTHGSEWLGFKCRFWCAHTRRFSP